MGGQGAYTICKQSVLTAILPRSVTPAPARKKRKKEGFRPHLQLPPTQCNETHTPPSRKPKKKIPFTPSRCVHRKQRAQGASANGSTSEFQYHSKTNIHAREMDLRDVGAHFSTIGCLIVYLSFYYAPSGRSMKFQVLKAAVVAGLPSFQQGRVRRGGGWWCAARSARLLLGNGHQGSRSASEKPTSRVTNARVSQHHKSVQSAPPRRSVWAKQHGQSEWSHMEIVASVPIPYPAHGWTRAVCTTYNVLPSERRGAVPPSQSVSSSFSQGQGRGRRVHSSSLSPSYRVINCVGTAIAMTSGRGCWPPRDVRKRERWPAMEATNYLSEARPGMGMSSARSGQDGRWIRGNDAKRVVCSSNQKPMPTYLS